MSSPQPLLCVVISTLNAQRHLQECLDSIYAQDNPAWEIIIIDGGSHDGTVDIIRQNASHLTYWLSEPDKGVYDAWNKALPHIRAPWVIFLGADDGLWSPHTLSTIAPTLTDPALGSRIVYGRVAFTDEQGNVTRWSGSPWQKISGRFKREMCIAHQGVFQHRALFAGGGFDTGFRYAGDYEFLLRATACQAPYFCDVPIARWRQGGLTSNMGNGRRVMKEFRRARAKNGIYGGHPWWGETKAWIKYALPKLVGPRVTGLIGCAYNRVRP